MSMIASFLQITPQELEGLIADPDAVEERVFPNDEQDPATLDIDKAWHGVHYLLTGDAWGGEKPLSQAILGGTEIGEDMGYGPVRYLAPDDVRSVAAALETISAEEFAARFDGAALTSAAIYPEIWNEGADAIDYLTDGFRTLRDFYLQAAGTDQAMLLFML